MGSFLMLSGKHTRCGADTGSGTANHGKRLCGTRIRATRVGCNSAKKPAAPCGIDGLRNCVGHGSRVDLADSAKRNSRGSDRDLQPAAGRSHSRFDLGLCAVFPCGVLGRESISWPGWGPRSGVAYTASDHRVLLPIGRILINVFNVGPAAHLG